jgi:enediyne polyketide synthase
VGASRVVFDDPNAPGPWTVRARETDRSGDTFTYDMQLLGRDGTLREAWVGLRLRRVESIPHEHWHPALLVPYLERRVAELLPGVRVRLALEREPTAEPGLIAMRHALGGDGAILRRGDGRPESPDGQGVAASHAGALTLAAAGGVRLTCDLEPVTPRAESLWADLLGSEHQLLARVLANALGESFDRSATRVWGALECLKKDGAGVATPLTLSAAEPDGWALLAGGGRRIASGVVRVAGEDAELAVALLEGPVGARL